MKSRNGSFVSDIGEIRRRAREHMESGAITSTYGADRETVIRLLNEALATELVCVARYKLHYYVAAGLESDAVKGEFLEHAADEQKHADWIAERIVQLGGDPDLNPEVLTRRSHTQYVAVSELNDMIKENLVAERIAIDSYREMIHFLGTQDSTTRRMLEKILAEEEEHADDMASLLSSGDRPRVSTPMATEQVSRTTSKHAH